MKRFVVSIIIIAAFCGANELAAQFKKGNVELNFGGSAGFSSSESKSGSNSHSSDQKYLTLSLMPGYYIIDGLSFEPEIGITSVESIKPGFLLLANMSYTHLFSNNHTAFFCRIGYGVSNASSITGVNMYSRMLNEMDMSVFNMGGGFKFLLGSNVYIKTELNYRSFSWEKEYSSSKNEYSTSILSTVFGIGLAL